MCIEIAGKDILIRGATPRELRTLLSDANAELQGVGLEKLTAVRRLLESLEIRRESNLSLLEQAGFKIRTVEPGESSTSFVNE
jgi:hypothetical protein